MSAGGTNGRAKIDLGGSIGLSPIVIHSSAGAQLTRQDQRYAISVESSSDYSDYLKHVSTISGITALFAGFDFTVLTLLLTRLPDPSSVPAQITLYAMSVLFLILIYLVAWTGMLLMYLCRRVPPMTPRLRASTVLLFGTHLSVGAPVFLMFFLWKMTVLASVTLLTWIAFAIASYVYLWRPLTRFKQTRDYFLGRP
jgi:hypothetical protein